MLLAATPATRPHSSIAWILRAATLFVALIAVGLPTSQPKAQDSTRIAYQLYEAMMGRFARGTPEETVPTLRILTEVAPEIPEVSYLYAIAVCLTGAGDPLSARNAAAAALGSQPHNPLFQMAAVISDPAFAARRADGYIALNSAGAGRLTLALEAMVSGSSNNARVLARELRRLMAASDEGDDGSRLIHLGNLAKQAGLFTVKVDESRFRAAEAAIIARIEGGPQRVSGEERAYRVLEKRADILIAELYNVQSPERVRAVADSLRGTLAEMGQIVSRMRNVVTDLTAIFGPLRRGREEIASLEADVRELEQARQRREELSAAAERQRRTAGAPAVHQR